MFSVTFTVRATGGVGGRAAGGALATLGGGPAHARAERSSRELAVIRIGQMVRPNGDKRRTESCRELLRSPSPPSDSVWRRHVPSLRNPEENDLDSWLGASVPGQGQLSCQRFFGAFRFFPGSLVSRWRLDRSAARRVACCVVCCTLAASEKFSEFLGVLTPAPSTSCQPERGPFAYFPGNMPSSMIFRIRFPQYLNASSADPHLLNLSVNPAL